MRSLPWVARWLAMAILCVAGVLAPTSSAAPAIVPAAPPSSWSSSGGSQEELAGQGPVFRSEVEMVRLNVAVFDDDGNPVLGLQAADFRVLEDGEERQVAMLLAPNEVQLDVALVLDLSGSIARSAPYAKRYALTFLSSLSAQDCVYVLPFNHWVGPGLWGGAHDPALRRRIERAPVEGGTALHDAMLDALAELRPPRPEPRVEASVVFELSRRPVVATATAGGATHDGKQSSRFPRFAGLLPRRPVSPTGSGLIINPELDLPLHPGCGQPTLRIGVEDPALARRQVMVVLTDGMDEDSVTTLADMFVSVYEAGVPIFPISAGAAAHAVAGRSRPRFGRGIPGMRAMDARRRQQELEEQWLEVARISGGKLIRGEGSERKMRQAYDEVLKLTRASYLLGYRPVRKSEHRGSEKLSWHQVEVEMERPGLRAVTRSGYYSSPNDRETARGNTETGIEILKTGQIVVALAAFEQALRADSGYWPAHYHRAMALAGMGRWAEAWSALQGALSLGPGVPDVQQLAWLISYVQSEFETAWKHAIRAHQAGADVHEFQMLLKRSTPPGDLDDRLNAPKIIVGTSDVPDLEVQISLRQVYRALSVAISESPGFGLVRNPQRAELLLLLDVDELEDRAPRALDAHLELYNPGGRRLYRKDLKIDDIDDPDALKAGSKQALHELQKWLREKSGLSPG